MSSKRKSDAKAPAGKRGRKKKVDDDFDSDSDSSGANGYEAAKKESVEVLIESTEDTKLPEELLKTFDREPGKLMVAGMVTWELTGRRDPKGKVTTIRPNLYTFHRFTDETVSGIFKWFFASSKIHNCFVSTVSLDCQWLQFGTQYFNQHGSQGSQLGS